MSPGNFYPISSILSGHALCKNRFNHDKSPTDTDPINVRKDNPWLPNTLADVS